MQEFSIRNRWIARAEVANKMGDCENSEDRILCAYKLINSLNNDMFKNEYIEALSDYLSEKEFAVVMSEINFDKFDNISFWVNKTVQDILDYYNRGIHRYKKELIEDKLKGAVSIFISDCVSPMSIKTAHELCDAIINTSELSFLHEVAFFEKADLANWVEDVNKSEDEHYLGLLDLGFAPYSLLDVYAEKCSEERYNYALKVRDRKKKTQEIAYQLSFKYLLEK